MDKLETDDEIREPMHSDDGEHGHAMPASDPDSEEPNTEDANLGAPPSPASDQAESNDLELAPANDDGQKSLSATGNERGTILIVHASVGSGHKSAAQAIQGAFELLKSEGKREYDYDVEVLDILDFGRIVFDGDSTASMFTGATRPIYDLTWRYSFTGRLLWGGGTIWARVMFPKFVEYVKEKQPKAIICTHITAANVAVSARMILNETFPIVCVPTDYEIEGLWPHKYTDLFCVADEHMAETLRPRKVEESRMLVTGIPTNTSFIEEHDEMECRRKFGIPEDGQFVLFLAGATLPRPYVHFRNAIDQLLPFVHTLENMHIGIVAGKDSDYADHLRRMVRDYRIENVTVFEFVTEMAQLMSAADVIVCKSGGLTVTECLCVNKAIILMGKAYGQEKANVTMLTSFGAAYHVTTPRELLDLLRKIDEHPRITQTVVANSSFLRRPRASIDIAEATVKLIDSKKDVMDPIYRKHFARFYWGGKPAHIR